SSATAKEGRGAEGLVLNGTYVRGDRRMAVINGAVYTEGQTISPASAGRAVSLARVDVDRVVLSVDRMTSELAYSRPTAAAEPPRTQPVHDGTELAQKDAVARDESEEGADEAEANDESPSAADSREPATTAEVDPEAAMSSSTASPSAAREK